MLLDSLLLAASKDLILLVKFRVQKKYSSFEINKVLSIPKTYSNGEEINMNIILTGFMGAGKTTIANLLAKKLKRKIVEIDELIIKKSKRKNIQEIFEKDGEIVFRELETKVARELQNTDNAIISTGGGVVMSNLNMLYLKKNGIVFYFKTPFSTIEKSLKNNKTRPLFQNNKEVKKLYKTRQPLYEYYADAVINTSPATNDKTVDKIIQHVTRNI